MLGSGRLGKRRKKLEEARGASTAMTEQDPSRPQIDSTEAEIESGQSILEQKKKRRQRVTKGNNPMVRGASVLGA